jgi:hypothetical protein
MAGSTTASASRSPDLLGWLSQAFTLGILEGSPGSSTNSTFDFPVSTPRQPVSCLASLARRLSLPPPR